MRVLDRTCVDKEDVRHLPEGELARMGIRLSDRQNVTLQCRTCGETWSPQLDANGKLAFDYHICPANCNR